MRHALSKDTLEKMMRKIVILTTLLLTVRAAFASPKIIFDTDMAGDCDDVGALAALHALADLEECEILAIVTSRKDRSNASAAACSAINHWYGRFDIPIGTDKAGGHNHTPPLSTFCPALRDEFPHSAKPDDKMPDALDVYREALQSAPDASVTICTVGALSNLDDLLEKEGALVQAKVKQLVVMGGEFPDSRKNRVECNIMIDVPAARNVADKWPTPVLYTGFEVGFVVHCGGELKGVPRRNPVRRAFELRPYGGGFSIDKGKPAYDQTAVLLAVRGAEERYWEVVRGGRMVVTGEGHTYWQEEAGAKQAYVKIKQGALPHLTGMIERLMCKPPLLNPAVPVRMIFDTDMGADIDDALALAVIHGLQNRGEAKLLAVTSSKDHPASASVIDMINTWFGRGDIPVGRVKEGQGQDAGRYLMQCVAAANADGSPRFPHKITPAAETMEAVALLRKTLAAQPDGSVVLAVVGQQTNAARLLRSGPDEYSELGGADLVRRKVRMLSVMAGEFVEQGGKGFLGNKPEWNIKVDPEAARIVMQEWPTLMVVCPYKLGKQLMFPGYAIEKDFDNGAPHPVAFAWKHYIQMPYDRPSWDLVSALYPVRPNRGYFNESETGRVIVDERGITTFQPDPKGNAIILSADPQQQARVLEALIQLSSSPPAGR